MRTCACSSRAWTCTSTAAATPSASPAHAALAAEEVLRELYELARTADVTPERVHLQLRERAAGAAASPAEQQVVRVPIGGIRARGVHQRDYLQNIRSRDLTFGIGPAGTGKTYLAVACAVEALQADRVRRLVLVRPAVEAGERLGFLPGDLTQKVDPYLRPMYDALYEMMGFDRVARFIERNVIEVAPLAFMRGRSLNDSFIILDEAQNTTIEQMKMFLTRIGFGSKAVVTGRCHADRPAARAPVGPEPRGRRAARGRGCRLHLLRCPGRRAPPAGAAHRAGVRVARGLQAMRIAGAARARADCRCSCGGACAAGRRAARELTRWASAALGRRAAGASSASRSSGRRRAGA